MARRKQTIIRWGVMISLAVLVALGTYHIFFALAAFGIMCGVIGFSELGEGIIVLTFLVPFAGIFKLSPNSTSLYTFAILFYCCRLIWENGYIQPLVVLFTMYIFATPFLTDKWNEFHYLRAIKLCCYLIILYYVFSSPKIRIDTKELFFVFVLAVTLSSAVGLMKLNPLRISDFIKVKTVGRGYEQIRFAGLFDDPNFYAVNVILAACLSVILYHQNWINLAVFFILFGMLGFFLAITYSKSAFLMVFFPIAAYIWSTVKKKNGIIVVIMVYAIFALTSFFWFGGKVDFLHIVLNRFSGHRGSLLDNLTTGRLSIWMSYIEKMLQEPMRLIFGFGVKVEKFLVNHRAPHNTYLEIVYSFGLVGSILLGWILFEITNLGRNIYIKRNFLNYIVFSCLAVMYAFIHETYTPEVLFHFIVGYTALNLEINTEK